MEPQEEQHFKQEEPEPTEDAESSHPAYAWEASEYVHHDKSASWYVWLWIAVALICAGLGLLQQWLSIAVIVVMAVAIVMYSRKQPRVLKYELDDHGITIDGKLTRYNLYKSYSIQKQIGWQEVDLEPSQRFSPRLTLLGEDETLPHIESILSQHLPRVDREPDFIERASRYLKF